jgi:hypothetical protein
VHVDSIATFIDFSQPDSVRLAWSLRISELQAGGSRSSFELRVDATDERAWRAARWYFAAIEPCVDWVARQVLGSIADELGWPTRFGRVDVAVAHA